VANAVGQGASVAGSDWPSVMADYASSFGVVTATLERIMRTALELEDRSPGWRTNHKMETVRSRDRETSIRVMGQR
jgi:hypothetical protein